MFKIGFFVGYVFGLEGLCLGFGKLGHKRVAKALIPIDVSCLTNSKYTTLKETKSKNGKSSGKGHTVAARQCKRVHGFAAGNELQAIASHG